MGGHFRLTGTSDRKLVVGNIRSVERSQFRSMLLPTSLYGSGNWIGEEKHKKKLKVVIVESLRSMGCVWERG